MQSSKYVDWKPARSPRLALVVSGLAMSAAILGVDVLRSVIRPAAPHPPPLAAEATSLHAPPLAVETAAPAPVVYILPSDARAPTVMPEDFIPITFYEPAGFDTYADSGIDMLMIDQVQVFLCRPAGQYGGGGRDNLITCFLSPAQFSALTPGSEVVLLGTNYGPFDKDKLWYESPLRSQRQRLLARLIAARSAESDSQAASILDDVVGHLAASLASELWVDQARLSPEDGVRLFADDLAVLDGLGGLPESHVARGLGYEIAGNDLRLAAVAVDDAAIAAGDQPLIAEAGAALARIGRDMDAGLYQAAVEAAQEVWQRAEAASAAAPVP